MRIRKLNALMGSNNAKEAASAHRKLIELLTKHALSWNDLPEILAVAEADARMRAATASRSGSTGPTAAATAGPSLNVLGLVERLVELYIAVTPDERIVIALWALHTHIFERYAITPRLALLSPVPGCGKTTLLILLEELVRLPWRTDDVTPAAIYYRVARESQTTFLIDEGDNLGLLQNQCLRRVFNSGHRRGGSVSRVLDGRVRKIPTFAPLAIAAIGNVLPRPLMHRSILINMQRPAPGTKLDPFDEIDPVLIAQLAASRAEIQKWARTCRLNPRPAMPAELHNREADNWRVLLAIADDLGHGEEARAAAVALTAGRRDEPVGVTMLRDIRDIFDALGIDRIFSKVLVAELLALPDGQWSEWRGPKDDRSPRKLTQNGLAEVLKSFGIHSRPVWLRPRKPDSKGARGYLRLQFEAAWAAYCPETPTTSQPNKIIHLAPS